MSTRCSHANDCPLFEKFMLSSALRIWQIFYCEKRFEQCARYTKMRDGQPVRPTLLPDGTDLEEEE